MAIVVLVAPLCEEILYRGLLWGGVEKLVREPVGGVRPLTTVLFAIAHFELHPHAAAARRRAAAGAGPRATPAG